MGSTVNNAALGVGSANSFTLTRILATVIQTVLIDRTVRLDSTTGCAITRNTGLTDGALFVTKTGHLAHISRTTLSLSAVSGVSAHRLTLAVETRVARTVCFRSAAYRSANAATISSRIWVESRQTGANW